MIGYMQATARLSLSTAPPPRTTNKVISIGLAVDNATKSFEFTYVQPITFEYKEPGARGGATDTKIVLRELTTGPGTYDAGNIAIRVRFDVVITEDGTRLPSSTLDVDLTSNAPVVPGPTGDVTLSGSGVLVGGPHDGVAVHLSMEGRIASRTSHLGESSAPSNGADSAGRILSFAAARRAVL